MFAFLSRLIVNNKDRLNLVYILSLFLERNVHYIIPHKAFSYSTQIIFAPFDFLLLIVSQPSVEDAKGLSYKSLSGQGLG